MAGSLLNLTLTSFFLNGATLRRVRCSCMTHDTDTALFLQNFLIKVDLGGTHSVPLIVLKLGTATFLEGLEVYSPYSGVSGEWENVVGYENLDFVNALQFKNLPSSFKLRYLHHRRASSYNSLTKQSLMCARCPHAGLNSGETLDTVLSQLSRFMEKARNRGGGGVGRVVVDRRGRRGGGGVGEGGGEVVWWRGEVGRGGAGRRGEEWGRGEQRSYVVGRGERRRGEWWEGE